MFDNQSNSVKRLRATPPQTASRDDDPRNKDRRRAEREAQNEEFKTKYTRAFPTFVFYVDWDADAEGQAVKERLCARVLHMGAQIDDFFSNAITHFITNKPIPSDDLGANKENMSRSRLRTSRTPSLLKSPIRLKGRATDEVPYDNLVRKAISFGMKVWSIAKLESVLDRCQAPGAPAAAAASSAALSNQRSLSRALKLEQLNGTTERDPQQKQYKFRYFSKNSYFVLVEDLKQELATIHAMEYRITKKPDGSEQVSWPVLHCHPKARGPFIEYDEREARRAAKLEKQDKEREEERRRRKAKLRERERRRRAHEEAQAQMQAKRSGDLRRTVSMVNLYRRVQEEDAANGLLDLDAELCDTMDSANASGYLQSGTYMAASGNSVSITSTTGTTSTAGHQLRIVQLPAGLRERLQQQVVTSRRVTLGPAAQNRKVGDMGPPVGIPERKPLRKSKSTNTMKLPEREEGSKPGYCECCRTKFLSFSEHIKSVKHRNFAANDNNFLQLDDVLARVRRQTCQETEAAKDREAAMRGDVGDHEYSPSRSESEEVEVDRNVRTVSSSEGDMLPPPQVQENEEYDSEADAEGEDDDEL